MASELEESADPAKDIVKEKIKREMSPLKLRMTLSTLIMALLSALGALLAGITANEFMVQRTREVIILQKDRSSRNEIEILKAKRDILIALEKPVNESEIKKIREFEGNDKNWDSDEDLEGAKVKRAVFEHEIFAIGVTILSIAITLSTISLLVNNENVWRVGLVVGGIGACLVGIGVYMMFS